MEKIFIVIAIVILLLFINNLKKYIESKENFIDPTDVITVAKTPLSQTQIPQVNKTQLVDKSSEKYVLPKVIYAFWDNLEPDSIVHYHMKNWQKKFAKDWKIILMNKDNVYKYVSNEFLTKYGLGQMDATRFSDFLRIELLTKNGGVWIDATIIIVNGKFLNDYYDEMVANKYDACFFEYKELTLLPTQPHIDNWFMMAPKGSKILTDLYSEFDKAFEMNFIKYKFDVILPSGILLDYTIGYGDSTYLLQHAIFHYLLKKGNKYNIILKNASDSMYKIHKIFDWDHISVIQYILLNNDWKDYTGIKLTKGNREAITDKAAYLKKLENF